MVYEWKVPKYRVDAQAAGEELERIEKMTGRLDPSDVLEASRDDGAVLHGCFEWDDEKAAELFRCDQAQCIIRNLVTVCVDGEQSHEPVRAFVSVSGTYKNMKSVMVNADYTDELLSKAKCELVSFKQKYQSLTQLAVLFSYIKEITA